MMGPISQIRLSARSLARSPGLSVLSIATLAIAIAAVTSVFAVLNRVVLQPLPYSDADRLVSIRSVIPGQNPDEVWGLSEAGYFDFADNAQTLEVIGAVDDVFLAAELTLSGGDQPIRIRGDSVSASIFDVLGARASHGRLFDARDDRPGAPLVIVLSHEIWTSYFGADPEIVGRTIRVEGTAREVVGIMEAGFRMPTHASSAWVPLRLDRSRPPQNDHYLGAIARLRPDATLEEARAELDRRTARFTEVFPDAYSRDFMERWGFATRVLPLREAVIGDAPRMLWTLLGSVAGVLLIAFANVGNLFLLRAEARRAELAIRIAHGASRWNLGAEGLAEGLIASGLAAGIGLLFAAGLLEALPLVASTAIPRLTEVSLGWKEIVAAMTVALVATAIAGPVPRLAARIDLASLRDGGAGRTAPPGRQAVRRTLVASQVALALTLLAAAGLMLRSFQRLHEQEIGFDANNLLMFQVALPDAGYPDPASSARFYRELERRFLDLTGVVGAGGVTEAPFGVPDGCWETHTAESPVDSDDPLPCMRVLAATPGYLDVLGVSFQGENPDWAAVESGTDAVIVTRAAADRLWPGESPIGRQVRGYEWGDAPWYRVAAVTSDLRTAGLDRAPIEAIFLPIRPLAGTPLHWGPFWGNERLLHVLVRTSADAPRSLPQSIREILADMDPDIAPGSLQTMSAQVARSESVARTSLLLILLAASAAVAVFLSSVGLFGVVAWFVRQHTHEIGLRMALGADVAIVTRGVLHQATYIAVAGVSAGLLATLLLTRILGSLLFEIRPSDPVTLACAAGLLMLVVYTAAWLPARRASRIDPIIALRD